MLIENPDLPKITQEELLLLPFIEYLHIVKTKSVDSIKSIFDLEFDTFKENVKRLEMMEMDVTTYVKAEIQKQWDFLNEEKNALMKTICSKTVLEVMQQKELISYLLNQYYLPDLEIANEELEAMADFLSGNQQPDPTRLSEEELAITDISQVSSDEQNRITAKLLGVSVTTLKLENKYRLDCIYCWYTEEYFKKLIEFNKSLSLESVVLSSDRFLKIRLPRIKERIANDRLTSLSSVQTALLFKILREGKVIFKDESYQPKENIYKAIQILTGYGVKGIKESMNLIKYKDSDKVVVQNFLSKLTIK